ncbi:MAG: SPFH domain-containing protein [Chloroflexota bacterium]
MADDLATDTGSADVPAAVAAAVPGHLQLTQVRVPLEDADVALTTTDEYGRLPIVVLPKNTLRIQNGLVGAGFVTAIASLIIDLELPFRGGGLGLSALFVILGIFRAFIVPVPEGSQAVLLKRGRFHKTLGPGNHFVRQRVVVSHIVTTRDTPFDAPATEIPTKDDVRTVVDLLLTFKIAEPAKFVFTVSAPDFDMVCRSACQGAIRMLIRGKLSDEIADLGDADAEWLRAEIGKALARYGVEVVRVVLTHVQPPSEFVASREGRRLATVQRAEEQERHALEVLRQADREELDRQRILARRTAIELEAANEVARLERLQARIRDFPAAMEWDVESKHLEVAEALAANTRAIVQVGPGVDVATSMLMHTAPQDGKLVAASNGTPPPVDGSSAAGPR